MYALHDVKNQIKFTTSLASTYDLQGSMTRRIQRADTIPSSLSRAYSLIDKQIENNEQEDWKPPERHPTNTVYEEIIQRPHNLELEQSQYVT